MEIGVDLALLAFLIGTFGLNAWLNIGRYRRLASESGTLDRPAFYRAGLVKSLILFLGGSIISLVILKRTDALAQIPQAFGAEALRSALSRLQPEIVYGVIITWIVVICLASLMGGRQMKRLAGEGSASLAALLPRNSGERFWALLISLNAGLSEELFFRLVVPLLLASVTGSAVLAFALSVLLFGLGHAYQGLWGIVTTTILGAMLGFIYLYTGQIFAVIAIHAGIDLWSLVVVPLLIGWGKKT